MVVTVISTEFLKKWWYKSSLLLSWLVGIVFYIFIFMIPGILERKFTFTSLVVFIVLTGLLNSAYKWMGLKRLVRKFIK
ncbi:MAG: hypothetical protein ACFFDN_19890 [Candidatus Hodarchaeota archaeon]